MGEQYGMWKNYIQVKLLKRMKQTNKKKNPLNFINTQFLK